MARITLNGFYEYDHTLFDIVLPDGMDVQTMIDAIIERSGMLYPYHQSFPALKNNISKWFERNLFQFSKAWEALNMEYNPIENYDRYEDSVTSPDMESKTTIKESAYNSDDYENKDESTTTQKGSNTLSSHVHGNIGVTTNAQMATQELQLRRVDFYEEIASRFEKHFIVQVY